MRRGSEMPRSWRLSSELFEIEAAGRFLVGMHPEMAILADGEIAFPQRETS